jgi:hypothetical protein
MDRRVIDDAMQAFEKSDRTRAADSASLFRRIGGKRKTTKLVAAAVIITAFAVMIYIYDGSFDVTTQAFAQLTQIREALNNVTWMHTVEVKRVKDKGRYEEWYLFDSSGRPKIGYSKSNGHVSGSDYANCLYTQYVPEANSVVTTYNPGFHDPWFVFNPEYLVDKWVERFEKSGVEVTHQAIEQQGVDVDVYCATDYEVSDDGERQLRSEFRLTVNHKRSVPISTSFKFWSADGTLVTDRDKKYSYPENGPKDVYELGVPESAEVIENSPEAELLEAVAGYRTGRDNSPLRYVAILVCSTYDSSTGTYLIDGVDRYCSDGHLQRCDLMFLKPVPEEQFREEAGNSFNSVMKWWAEAAKQQSGIRYEWTTLYGEERVLRQRRSGGKTEWTTSRAYSPSRRSGPMPLHKYVVDRDILSELGWTRRLLIGAGVSWNISLVEDHYSKDNNLLCLEALGDWSHFGNANLKHRFYLDPARDYTCQKLEMHRLLDSGEHGEYSLVIEVLEYGRLRTGQWYPRKISEHSKYKMRSGSISDTVKMTTVYLSEDPRFPEGIFDTEKLSE